jgi:short-subunit dehydrogenase
MGCTLGLLARREEVLERVARQVVDAGGAAMVLPCDVGDYARVKECVGRLAEAHGPIDCMIANAGIGVAVRRHEFDPGAIEQVFRTNVIGMTNAFCAVLPGMLERRRGHLVGVSSLAGYVGMPEDAGYSASKAAQRIQCEGMRIELRGTGVDVTTICPGFIRTPMTDQNEFDMPVLLEVDVAARKILRAIARRKRVCTFPWQLWWLVKLGRHAPRWLYDAVIDWQNAKVSRGRRTQRRSTEP